MNTHKIGKVIAEKINASMIDINNTPNDIQLDTYDLIGFGAGIGSFKHYSKMLNFAKKLPNVNNKKVFIFSTGGLTFSKSGMYSKKKMLNDHKALRDILQDKGFIIIDEFACVGHFYFIFKCIGFHKNRPNVEDIKNAEIFSEKLLKKCESYQKQKGIL